MDVGSAATDAASVCLVGCARPGSDATACACTALARFAGAVSLLDNARHALLPSTEHAPRITRWLNLAQMLTELPTGFVVANQWCAHRFNRALGGIALLGWLQNNGNTTGWCDVRCKASCISWGLLPTQIFIPEVQGTQVHASHLCNGHALLCRASEGLSHRIEMS